MNGGFPIDLYVKRIYNKGILNVKRIYSKVYSRARKLVAEIVARRRLARFLKENPLIRVSAYEYESLVFRLSNALCASGIFKPRRVKNFKEKYCANCLYNKDSEYGKWCILKDVWMHEIKDEYCGGYTERGK